MENFGPIEKYEQTIESVNLLIGPQASGKSTISKLVFFFRSMRDDLLKYVLKDKEESHSLHQFAKQLRSKFISYFGTTKHMSPFKIVYYYSEHKFVTLTLRDGYVQINYNKKLKEDINNIFKKVEEIRKGSSQQQGIGLSSWDVAYWSVQDKKITDEIKNNIDEAFEDNRTAIFIPAGRSLVSILADQLQTIHPYEIDQLMQDFLERIHFLKKTFAKSFDEIIQDRKKLSSEKIDFNKIDLAIQIINKILKGKYVFSSDGEKIYFNEKEYVKLIYSSSGQQEVVWIVLLLFVILLENRDVFIVIEEPEAHLFPEAQKDIVELISLLINTSSSHIIITTHSPYILSAFNIYLYAGQLTDALDKQSHLKIDKKLRITKPFTAFLVNRINNQFSQNNIVDEDLHLVKAEVIDGISNEMNILFDQLLELED